jgi:hypothetical protein
MTLLEPIKIICGYQGLRGGRDALVEEQRIFLKTLFISIY